jgi:hypothetical protein
MGTTTSLTLMLFAGLTLLVVLNLSRCGIYDEGFENMKGNNYVDYLTF